MPLLQRPTCFKNYYIQDCSWLNLIMNVLHFLKTKHLTLLKLRWVVCQRCKSSLSPTCYFLISLVPIKSQIRFILNFPHLNTTILQSFMFFKHQVINIISKSNIIIIIMSIAIMIIHFLFFFFFFDAFVISFFQFFTC